MTILMLFQDLPIEPVVTQYEKITNPILAILIAVLIAVCYFLYKQIGVERKANLEKDTYIKEQNTLFLNHAIKSVEVMKGLQSSIENDSGNHRTIEELVRQNNIHLQTILRESKP